MLLRYGLRLPEAADLVDRAVAAVLAGGMRTADIARPNEPSVGTREVGEAVARHVLQRGAAVAGAT